jgi:hypothetical protein
MAGDQRFVVFELAAFGVAVDWGAIFPAQNKGLCAQLIVIDARAATLHAEDSRPGFAHRF